ncbi:MAG TPA: ComF family protein [Verrucomicrobiae bacterium]|nr:ComF family protein [Verrucomicrobiae bacterium]
MTSVTGHLKPWLNKSLGLFYPEVCQLCNAERATADDGFVGPQCWAQVRFIRAPFCDRCGLPFEGDITTKFECTNCRELKLHFTSARSAVVAKTTVLEAIHRFKYSRALWFEPFLADLLQREAAPVLRGANWDFIVPVPLHPLKQREREFNQAEILARHLSRATAIPLNTKLLQRTAATATQTRLKRDQRTANMHGAFALCKGADPKGKRIVIVDDVFTTGATTNACAKVLHQAGAAETCVWTVARGL